MCPRDGGRRVQVDGRLAPRPTLVLAREPRRRDERPVPAAFGDNARVIPTTEAVLPEGTRLLHIGPHKTGTTALQAALWNARPALLAQSVRHVGRSKNPSSAARSVVDQPSPYSTDKPPSIGDWHALLREFRRASEARVVVSSEFFAWAKPDAIKRIADEIDPARIQVAVTVRQLAKVIPSMWQQNVQAGAVTPFGDWLNGVVDESNRSFWHLERHDALIDRWSAVVGLDRMTVVVADDREHDVLLRSFEGLLGLADGTLVGALDYTNRSLTMPEAEAVRAFNVLFKEEGLPLDLHARTMRFGAAQHMKQRVPPEDEPRVALPAWALEPIAAIQQEIVDNIRAAGVRVLGDLDVLTRPAAARHADPEASGELPPAVAGSLGMGLLISTGAVRTAAISKGLFKFAEPAEVARIPTYILLGTIGGRAWRSVVGRIPLPRRRTKPA